MKTKFNEKHDYIILYRDDVAEYEVIERGANVPDEIRNRIRSGWVGVLNISIERIKLGKGTWE